MSELIISDKYDKLYTALVESIQNKHLTITKSLILTNGQWKIFLEFTGKVRCYIRFSYDDSKSKLSIDRRNFIRYKRIAELSIDTAPSCPEKTEEAIRVVENEIGKG